MESQDERYQYLHDWRMTAQKKDPDYLRRKALKELYKVTVEWYEDKLKSQDGHCALCDATQQAAASGKRLSVDHDHGHCPTKRPCGQCNRGLLCFNCNKKLGMLEIFMRNLEVNSPTPGSWEDKAMQYLDSYKPAEFAALERKVVTKKATVVRRITRPVLPIEDELITMEEVLGMTQEKTQ